MSCLLYELHSVQVPCPWTDPSEGLICLLWPPSCLTLSELSLICPLSLLSPRIFLSAFETVSYPIPGILLTLRGGVS